MSKLTDLKVKAAQPREKPYKLADGGGLCLTVMPDGARYWRLRYDFAGKERMLSVGVYPIVSLKEARERAQELKGVLAQGIDPSERRREQKLSRQICAERTFGAAANAWYDFTQSRWRPATANKVRAYLDKDVLPTLASRRIRSVTPMELVAVVEAIEKRSAFNVAKKTRQWLNQIFRFAVARGLTDNNPAQNLFAVAAPAPESKRMAHLTLDELPDFLRALDNYSGSALTKAAIEIALLTANRPGVIRTLRWDELDLESGIWKIARGRLEMKRGYAHTTPLPNQAVAILRDVHRSTGTFRYVFAGRNDPGKPMSDTALSSAIRRMGFDGRQTVHGFRHLISTALNDRGYRSDWIERQLAHGDPDRIRGTYNEAQYLDPRRDMMQDWAD
ncbi:MAG TPA: integrase arm-type DNA-binding domain-containing protein, partial [Rhodanobacteraceae bacterium]|nr:integrase arm-type DNA-binding domain-containing protein [Rhodanobacteraceae bacterium]